MKAIINGKILTKEEVLEGKVLIFNEKIIDIKDFDENEIKRYEVIDAKGLYVSPGLVDIHIHGSGGYDTMDNEKDAVKVISETICKTGVTSFLPTTMTMAKEDIYNSLKNIKYFMSNKIKGAKVLGTHLEGPFINEKYKGAQNANYIQSPTFDFIKDYIDIIKIISYSPETDIDFSFTKSVLENTDIVLSICHTELTYDEGKKYVNLGVSNITHLFNAMTPLNHREPGIVGLSLMDDRLYCEIIADKIHVNKDLFDFVIKNKGLGKLVLITDSMRAGCMKDGEYDLGGQKVTVKDGAARLTSGNLAGSVLTLNKAVFNYFENTNLKINEAINLASINPANSINEKNIGKLEVGYDSDIALFDENMECYMTLVNGEIVYKR